jgi:hypothetical protein
MKPYSSEFTMWGVAGHYIVMSEEQFRYFLSVFNLNFPSFEREDKDTEVAKVDVPAIHSLVITRRPL